MSTTPLLNDCFLHDKDRLRHNEALGLIIKNLTNVCAIETIPLASAHRRILAENISAPRPIPAFDNAAVDGFAFCHGAQNLDQPITIAARIAAGDQTNETLFAGTAARIFTGAAMPPNADTVAMQEDCIASADGKSVLLPKILKAGANCRKAGEDVAKGAIIASAHQALRPQDLAAIASTGKAEILVFKKLRVAILSTGNELLQIGEPYQDGTVYDANRVMLQSLIADLPITVTDLGALPDNADQIKTILQDAAQNHDLIISSGGASRGEEDHIVTILDHIGKRHLWQIAVKPGRPLVMGQIGNCALIGLPGNPVAAFVCGMFYLRATITTMTGGTYHPPQSFKVASGFEMRNKKPDRREFLRAWLQSDENGKTTVQKFSRDGSGLISGLTAATGFIELNEEVTTVKAGHLVDFIPFQSFFLP